MVLGTVTIVPSARRGVIRETLPPPVAEVDVLAQSLVQNPLPALGQVLDVMREGIGLFIYNGMEKGGFALSLEGQSAGAELVKDHTQGKDVRPLIGLLPFGQLGDM